MNSVEQHIEVDRGILNNPTTSPQQRRHIEEELHELLDSHRSKNGSWDVIVPSSGGKDSVFVSHQLKFNYYRN